MSARVTARALLVDEERDKASFPSGSRTGVGSRRVGCSGGMEGNVVVAGGCCNACALNVCCTIRAIVCSKASFCSNADMIDFVCKKESVQNSEMQSKHKTDN